MWLRAISLWLLGYCKIGDQYFVNCSVHGYSLAIRQGYDGLFCVKCLLPCFGQLNVLSAEKCDVCKLPDQCFAETLKNDVEKNIINPYLDSIKDIANKKEY